MKMVGSQKDWSLSVIFICFFFFAPSRDRGRWNAREEPYRALEALKCLNYINGSTGKETAGTCVAGAILLRVLQLTQGQQL